MKTKIKSQPLVNNYELILVLDFLKSDKFGSLNPRTDLSGFSVYNSDLNSIYNEILKYLIPELFDKFFVKKSITGVPKKLADFIIKNNNSIDSNDHLIMISCVFSATSIQKKFIKNELELRLSKKENIDLINNFSHNTVLNKNNKWNQFLLKNTDSKFKTVSVKDIATFSFFTVNNVNGEAPEAYDYYLKLGKCDKMEFKLDEKEHINEKTVLITYDSNEFDITKFDRKILTDTIVELIAPMGTFDKELLNINVYCGSVKITFELYDQDTRKKVIDNIDSFKENLLESYINNHTKDNQSYYVKNTVINMLFNKNLNPYSSCNDNSMDCTNKKGVPLPYNNEFENSNLKNIYRGVVDPESDPYVYLKDSINENKNDITTTPSPTTTTTTTTTTTPTPTTTDNKTFVCRTHINKGGIPIYPLKINIENDFIKKISNPFTFKNTEKEICNILYKPKNVINLDSISYELEENSGIELNKSNICKFKRFAEDKRLDTKEQYAQILNNEIKRYCSKIILP